MANLSESSASVRSYAVHLPILLVVLVSIYVLYSIARATFSPLKSVPGPFGARFTRLWYLSKVWRGDFERTNIHLHKKYGPIVRIAPHEYSIDDIDAIKTIYGHGTNFTKANWYRASGNPDPMSHDLFTDQNPKRHAISRRKVAALYSMTTLMQMEPMVHESTSNFLARLTEMAESNVKFNLQFWLQCFAFDTIGLITLSKRFGFLDKGEDKEGLLAALHSYLIYCANVGIYSEFHQAFSRILGMLPSSGMTYMQSFTSRQISERVQRADEEKVTNSYNDDFLGKVLKMHQEQPDKFTMKDVFTTCITNIGAGSDTTSVSLAGILYQLMKTPKCLEKVTTEIDQSAARGEISRPITFQEAQKLPYLQACIKEGLRMHPATGLPLARVVPEGGAVIAGRKFPAGTVVGVNAWVAHAQTAIFGEDAGSFRPERWLESPERASIMERYFMTFGAGSRTCIGKNISLMEISILVPEVLRSFEITLARPDRPLETENVWFVKQKNIECHVRLRAKN